MKKVISALTVAAMCASMAASTMPAIAAYKTGDVSTYLKVVDAGKGTVSSDGKTITFASAADAASSSIVVGQYLVADTAAPSIQQIAALYTADSAKIHLGSEKTDEETGETSISGAVYTNYADGQGPAEKEYTVNGNTFSTNRFVNCFGYFTRAKKYMTGGGAVSWGHSSNWKGDGWKGNGDNEVLMLTWAYDFADKNTHPDDYKETAHFLTDKSDELPFTEFEVSFDSSIADGSYEVTFLDSYTHPEYGKMPGNWVYTGADTIDITDTTGITIKIGDSTVEKPTEAPTEKPTEKATEEVEKPTESDSGSDKENLDKWTWYVDDVEVDPDKADDGFEINVVMGAKDPGIFGYEFSLLIDGKEVTESDFEIDSIEPGSAYGFQFQGNAEIGRAGAAENTKEGDTVAADGAVIATFMVFPKAGVTLEPGKEYKLSLGNMTVGNFAREDLTPATIDGILKIKGGEENPTDKPTEAPTDAPTDKPTDKPTEAPTEQQTGDYIYGDVNENGKVELVDVVKLNRFLTGLDASLSAKATVQANCYRNGENDKTTTANDLDGKDSMEILKKLIGSVVSLPTQA